MALSALPSLLAACVMLAIGAFLADRVTLLARFSIPAPIVGGLLFAGLTLLLQQFAGIAFTRDTTTRSTLLLLFFASIGLTADLSLLRRGGPRLLRFLLALFPFLIMQDALGIVMAQILRLHPVLGLVAGSVTLVGGHGTGAAYAERFAADYGLLGVMGLTMTSATIGLVIGGVLGGPVSGSLIRRIGGLPAAQKTGDVVGGPAERPVTTGALTVALAAVLAAVIAGQAVSGALEGGVVTVPSFLWCLLIGLVLRNVLAAVRLRLPDTATELIGSFSLSLFLVWTMMNLDLVSVVTLAGPLLIILAGQTVLVALWARVVVFRICGRDYEAAVSAGAFCGFAMGATATAIANMQAVTRRYGPAPESFVVVPIVGAFFVDLMNLAVLTFFLIPGLVVGR
ncbi:MAG: sodium/glutamate symporter [Proteobacteria bacterium]|nr:sodium/glutamate symporter [Pseudomonadota bacterium]